MPFHMLFVGVLTVLLCGGSARASEAGVPAPVPLESFEEILKDTPVVEDATHLKIRMHDHFLRIPLRPDVREMSELFQTEGLDPMRGYHALDEGEKIRFLHLRRAWLRKVAQALRSSRGLIGAGLVAGDRLTFLHRRQTWDAEHREMPRMVRSEQVIENVLRVIDMRLWYQAPLFLNTNEYTVELSIALQGQVGISRWSMGGLFALGFSFGYNREKKALVFEIFRQHEYASRSFMPILVAGVRAKLGFALEHVVPGSPRRIEGHTMNPWFSPRYTEWSPEHFGVGVKGGVQIPPFARFFRYQNQFERRTMLRIAIGIVPFHDGVIRVARRFHQALAFTRGRACSQVF